MLSGYITVDDGVRLYFRTLGDGLRPVIIPNGLYLLDDFRGLAPGRTLIAYDPRNRGLSDTITHPAKLAGGIHNDVDDLEAVRRHFGIQSADLIGHSYIGWMLMLYAIKYPDHIRRVAQIGAMPPDSAKQYPAHLTGEDGAMAQVFARIGQLQKERSTKDPAEMCRKFWEILRVIYVTKPEDAVNINWGRCDLANERAFMKYWAGSLLPSIQNTPITREEAAKVRAEVLTIHGTRDRSAPYGGAQDWAELIPHARLVTIAGAGHAPWIEAPGTVFAALEAFFA